MTNKFEIRATKVATDVIVSPPAKILYPPSSGDLPIPTFEPEDRVGFIMYNNLTPNVTSSEMTSFGLDYGEGRYTLLGDEAFTGGANDYRWATSYQLAQLGIYAHVRDTIEALGNDEVLYTMALVKLYSTRTTGQIRDMGFTSYDSRVLESPQLVLGSPVYSLRTTSNTLLNPSLTAPTNILLQALEDERFSLINAGQRYIDWSIPTPDADETDSLINPSLVLTNSNRTGTFKLAPKKHPMATEVSIFNADSMNPNPNMQIICFSYNGSPKLYARLQFPGGNDSLGGVASYSNMLVTNMNVALDEYRSQNNLPRYWQTFTTNQNDAGVFEVLATVKTNISSPVSYDLVLNITGRGSPRDLLGDLNMGDGYEVREADDMLTIYPDITGHPWESEIEAGWDVTSIGVDTDYVAAYGTPQPFNVFSRQFFYQPIQA